MKREDTYYEAMKARDHRFDGKFFVGVKTTGIYCRPICPAKPKRENVEFFHSRYEAEKAGYRPCMRCRPESAPQSPAWVGKSAIVQRAVKILNSQDAIEVDERRFAERFGVTARHLRRLFIEEIGKTPKQLAFENRLNLARKLLTETALPVAEVAFASGFSSIRRFNGAFKDRFKKAPSQIRRRVTDGADKKADEEERFRIRVPYRPPFDFEGLMKSYKNHRIGNLEWFDLGAMHRVIAVNGKVGQVVISNDPKSSSLVAEIDFPDTSVVHAVIARIRNLFDLNSDPVLVANALEADPGLKKLLRKYPGIRLPSGWDPFEVSVSTILGQVVSIERGRSLTADLIEIAGRDSGIVVDGKRVKLFPTPREITESDLSGLKTSTARKQTLIEFCKAIHEGRISLESTQDVGEFSRRITAIKGIGPWTAQYIALKALRDADSLPASDLILAQALKKYNRETIDRMSPWRGYVAALLWRQYGTYE